MAEPCDYSRLTLPNDPSYVEVAAAFVRAVAVRMGFDREDVRSVELATREAVSNVVEHAFEPREQATFEVSCERVTLGLKISVRDKGLPFDSQSAPECVVDPSTGPGPGCGILAMKEYVDEVSFNNLGSGGKEAVLVKYFKDRDVTQYFEACELGPFAPSQPAAPERREPGSIIVRAMAPSEAVEVARCMYRAYGYSHTAESIYIPDRIIRLNQSGDLYSAVAVTQNGEVAGHAALIRESTGSRIAETALGVVKPEFRSRGIFNLLEDHLLARAKAEGLTGVFARAVTTHTYSQQTGLRYGARDCALMVGLVPQTTWFRGIAERLTQRETIVTHFQYLEPPRAVTVYPPSHHRDMIERLYENIRGAALAGPVAALGEVTLECTPILRTRTSSTMNFARIYVEAYGHGIVTLVRTRLRELCLERYDVIHLYLDLFDPLSGALAGQFEDLGFFFSGILPGALPGDALILQYLNNVPIDYDKIRVSSRAARELVSYVRERDPGQK